MELQPYLEALGADLRASLALGDPGLREAAADVVAAMRPALRLSVLDVVTDAAAEIDRQLPDAAVDVRLAGGAVDLVVRSTATAATTAPEPVVEADPGDVTRLTLRMPDSLKSTVEQAAAAEGTSVNAWLVRAVAAAVRTAPEPQRSHRGHVTGTFRS